MPKLETVNGLCFWCNQTLDTPATDISQGCWAAHRKPPCDWCGVELTNDEFAACTRIAEIPFSGPIRPIRLMRTCEKCRGEGQR